MRLGQQQRRQLAELGRGCEAVHVRVEVHQRAHRQAEARRDPARRLVLLRQVPSTDPRLLRLLLLLSHVLDLHLLGVEDFALPSLLGLVGFESRGDSFFGPFARDADFLLLLHPLHLQNFLNSFLSNNYFLSPRSYAEHISGYPRSCLCPGSGALGPNVDPNLSLDVRKAGLWDPT